MTFTLAPVSFSNSGARRCSGSAICGPVKVRMLTVTPAYLPPAGAVVAAGPVVAAGAVVAAYPRHSRQRILLDPSHYEGPGNERVAPPVPLGKMGRRLQEILLQPVEQRPLDLYAALAEVAR